MLTDRQRHKLAREARKLAMECVEGSAPPLIAGEFYYRGRCCVLGEVARRSGFNAKAQPEMRTLFFGGEFGSEERVTASEAATANNLALDKDRHAAVVFPLLAYADALDEPRAAPSPTPNTRKER